MGTIQSDLLEHNETDSSTLKSGVSSRKKVLMLSMYYPLAMVSYWRRAFQRRDDIELRCVGPYTANWIPWAGGMTLLPKYAIPIEYPLGGAEKCNQLVPFSSVQFQLGDWKPDLIVTVDAMCNWTEKPFYGCPVVTIGTDAHCLNTHYDHARRISDIFINMHQHYAKDGDVVLPYAFDPTVHYKVLQLITDVSYDCACVGMGYAHRTKLIEALRAKGLSVYYENGPVFDEYREVQNRAKIGINYSSSDDLNARVFELMAMGTCPVINYVPDLEFHFSDGVDYVGFSTIDEAVYKVEKLLECPEAIASISRQAHDTVWALSPDGYPIHSYDQRVHDLLKIVGMI